MYKLILIIFSLSIPLSTIAQTFTSPQVIDQGSHLSGITSITTADIDNDTLTDVIVALGYNKDKVIFYLNQGQGNFSTSQLIDSNALNVEAIKTVDINEDGWLDVVSICRFDSTVYWYPNTNGSFPQKLKIDSGIFQLNDLTIHDFDGDNHEDIVVIGQHSIDIHFGDGNGGFTKNHILTTSTSPNSLECIDLEKVDMNNDGDMDLLVAETIGAVVYTNNGSGSFTPQTINTYPITGNLVHSFDIDNDNDFDVLLRHGSASWELFRNNGNSSYSALGSRNNLPGFQSVQSMDFTNDSLPDLYGTYSSQIDLYYNDSLHNFSANTTTYQNNNINFTYESDTAELNQNGATDFVFATVSGYLAWHEFNASTSLLENKIQEQKTIFYPNPASGFIHLKTDKVDRLEIYTLDGKLVREIVVQKSVISIQSLPKGTYLLQTHYKKSIQTQLLIKE
jgi:hypothetical protein